MELIKKKISLRCVEFGELSAKVSWLRKFFIESRVYRYCKRYSSSYWRDEGPAGVVSGCDVELTVNDAAVSEEFLTEPEYGDYVVVSSSAETFNHYYNSLSEAKAFFEEGCNELENGGGKPDYFSLHVLLTEKYEDLGRFVNGGESEGISIPKIQHEPFSVYTDSKLEMLKRRTKSYDIDGNELPFVLTADKKCEIPYTAGLPHNIREGLYGDWFYDIIDEIRFEDETGGTGTVKTNGTVTASDSSESFPIICIRYEIGRRKYEDGTEEDGVIYEEKYYYSIKSETLNINGRLPETYRYIDIDYSSTAGDGWENVSAVLIDGENESLGTYNFIFDEATAGAHDYSESAENVYIERGSSASFEPLNLMGQFSSVEEIERYRNDLFKITKENA